ncbi:6748_t:CDS:2 [Paraglomus brasilianum]|uniref:6748_t:CDS:1 n=1 Tax=Paraglomus brasilianum TaxID=144538 RepID=A0A9N9CRC0_9GLOM|nr:6748_t:CDS:2 [Paraglomus brasilianum]
MSWKGLISKNLKELRIHFCQKSDTSNGVREFLKKSYPELKKQNPHFPFLVREASGVEARFFARYDYGIEKKSVLDNLSAKDVEAELEKLVKGSS